MDGLEDFFARYAERIVAPRCSQCGADAIDLDFERDWICPACPLPIVVNRTLRVQDLLEDPDAARELQAA